MPNAIEILRASQGECEQVKRAVRMHMECPECKGHGGVTYYPECPCSTCGFNYADSFGVEEIMDIIASEE